MSMYTDSYFMGQTNIAVGLSAPVQFIPPAMCNGWQFKISTGAGTLAIIQDQYAGSTTYIGGSACARGYQVGASEVVSASGPARFYLAAVGATMTVSLLMSFTSGLSAATI